MRIPRASWRTLSAGLIAGLLGWPVSGPLTIAAQGAGADLPRCHTEHLSVEFVDADAGMGHVTDRFRFTNLHDAPCQMYGFVGAQMLDAAGQPLPTVVRRNGGIFADQAGPTDVALPPGASAMFQMRWTNVPTGNERSCPAAAQVEITPPDETAFLVLALGPFTLAPCNGGTIDVTPVQPLEGPSEGQP